MKGIYINSKTTADKQYKLRLPEKSELINSEVRKVFTQGTQSFDFNAYLLCALINEK